MTGPLLGATSAWADTSTGSISGLVWFDRDSDHQRDNGEPVYGGSTVTITNLNDGSVTTATTDELTGTYRVDDLAQGFYKVSGAQTGYVSTTARTTIVGVTAGHLATADFGVRGATITGNTWNDANGDGIRQSGESALAGVQMFAYSAATTHAAEGTSDAAGNYQIQDLPASSYRLSLFSQVHGYGLTRSGGDSVLDPVTGNDPSVQVKAGQQVGPLDAGFVAAKVDTAITGITVPSDAKVGDQVSVTVDVANLSNVTEVSNATVTLPAGLTPVSATATGGLASFVSGQNVYLGSEVSNVAAGTTVELVVQANVTAPLSNAPVSATTPVISGDVNPANNSLTQVVNTVG
ncbi:MAG TPA: SdrD B-like domain-containing protein [Pseudonocardiaceae bacterium]